MTGQNPHFIYGTAWKEERTADLTFAALIAGFRAIDTANQRKHYNEEGVGQGLQRFLKEKSISRDEIFLQTKYTYARGQDHRKPYNEADPFHRQVKNSFASSLKHLGADRIDSYVLHGPYTSGVLTDVDFEVWETMEALQKSGQVSQLGVSNVNASQLRELCAKAQVKPTYVQNRCYARMGWDYEIRQICKEQKISYQGFSLLTANRLELSSDPVAELATKYEKTIPQIVFRFAHQLGMICLTGTTNSQHMKMDLDIMGFELKSHEIEMLEKISFDKS